MTHLEELATPAAAFRWRAVSVGPCGRRPGRTPAYCNPRNRRGYRSRELSTEVG